LQGTSVNLYAAARSTGEVNLLLRLSNSQPFPLGRGFIRNDADIGVNYVGVQTLREAGMSQDATFASLASNGNGVRDASRGSQR
jgi:hypothetical protein